MACDANSLASDARCLCASVEQQFQLQTYLLAVIAGVSTDPNVLSGLARCFCGIPADALMALKTYLLCQITEGLDVLPAGPNSEQWSLFLEPDSAFISASDNGSGYSFYCYRYRINGGSWISGGPTAVGVPVGPFGSANDVVEAQTRYCDGTGTALSEWSGIKEVTNAGACADAIAVTNFTGSPTRGVDPAGYIASFTFDAHAHPEIITEQQLVRSDTEFGVYDLVQTLTGADFSANDDGTVLGPLDPQTTYYYKIVTIFNNGCPDAETAPFALDSGCQAAASGNVTQADEFLDHIVVEWAAPAATPILNYLIQWGLSSGVYTGSDTVPSADLTYTITGLDPSTTYFVLLTSRDTLTCGSAAPEAELHTLAE